MLCNAMHYYANAMQCIITLMHAMHYYANAMQCIITLMHAMHYYANTMQCIVLQVMRCIVLMRCNTMHNAMQWIC